MEKEFVLSNLNNFNKSGNFEVVSTAIPSMTVQQYHKPLLIMKNTILCSDNMVLWHLCKYRIESSMHTVHLRQTCLVANRVPVLFK